MHRLVWHNKCVKLSCNDLDFKHNVRKSGETKEDVGAGEESNQDFGQSADRGKSYHCQQTGGKPSVPKKKTNDQSSNQNLVSIKKNHKQNIKQ